MARFHGVGYGQGCTSGTAAVHLAVAALDPEPGDEVITTPITDQGTIIPVLYQNAVPIFADIDPETFNMDLRSVEDTVGAFEKVETNYMK
ncbi:MAG TPA: DegT/DnrJ/EryC1/StrS aminotransferase family protein [Candidatus Latescibacteria bacterium]|nr:DegT/DnrJ/EryC1/StrS aminotransferase family protein [Candidatus Latescibacterota bacterium]